MIHGPQTIFNDFVPGGFNDLKYLERIKQKSLNELNSKVKYLRRQLIYVEHLCNLVEKGENVDLNSTNRQFIN